MSAKLKRIINYTIFGLSPSYYFRNLLFGLLPFYIGIFTIFNNNMGLAGLNSTILLFGLLGLCFPYTRLAYDGLTNFLIRDTWFINGFLYLFFCLIRNMVLLAITPFVTPFSLLYLYFYHARQEKKLNAYYDTMDQDF